ncbi:MAG TPA: hypothetical protein EYP49_13145, partial [Anaerolineae bacterium]|nr:hypothetical protein [Anaerolineae bacterium]
MPSWLQNLLSNELVKAFLQSLLTIGTLVAIGRAIWKWLEERKRERSISRAAPDIHVPLRPDRILRGRGAERAELKSYFEKHNLVVIQGIAGVGKTKLGEAFAQHVADTTDFRLVWIGCRPAMGLGSLMSNLAVHIATRYKEKELGELLKDYRPADAIDWINKAVNA